MITQLWWTWAWAITSSNTPFMWTVRFQVGGQNLTAESSVAKLVTPWGDPSHVKTSVYSYAITGGSGAGNWWGIDGAPIRYLSNVSYMTFALEVQRAYGAMVAKLYIH
jgi:hypothetical protein